MVEAYLGVIVFLLIVMLGIGSFALARGYESARQRDERHRLKAELAAAKLLLQANGIEFPPVDES